MSNEQHSTFTFNGLPITAQPMESLANVLQSIEDDRPFQPCGRGGLGKTSALEFLPTMPGNGWSLRKAARWAWPIA